ncbi:hypothetical protein KC331_g7756 [Hortaea werneckii]|uniref:Transcription factor CBF/NF-Y/archaeal histone domain-containing protein n=1 Tax=Hortaea werneckii TaxID=91943 RepID=A0A3M7BX80_HORWE|nr:hypothetical protein KC331_g7756 [Hortaea werneckii]KAI7717531.1 hypothetical protein KC353_g4504 [Hortaea werneckii]RMY44419.1 hypothetical protein D0865_10563 [Hortaea werneckii]
MDPYRPQSPQLSSYAPQSPDLSGRPQSPDLSGQPAQPAFGSFNPLQQQQSRFGGAFGGFHGGGGGGGGGGGINYPTSVPQQGYHQPYYDPHQQQHHHHHHQIMAAVKTEDGDYYPDAPPTKRPRGRPPGSGRNQLATSSSNGRPSSFQQPAAPSQPSADPTLGVELRTSFPVARIKRIMQADEDVGKVAQVTPHVVSRALELFMIKLISASAMQARGGGSGGSNIPPSIKSEGSSGAAGSGATTANNKGPKRILAQHMKKAIQADETLDFLADIAEKVPDAPSKQSAAAAKKEAASNPGSDSEGEVPAVKPKRKGRKRKDSADD